MRRLRDDDSGATLVEYALILAFIFAVAFAAVQAFGGSVVNLFDSSNAVWP